MGIRRVGGVLVRLFSAVAVALILPGAALADPGPTVSNGGYMQSVDAKGEAVVLPLKHTDVEADIAGTVASVKVTQRFHNSSSRPIEAVYVFPLPHRAAVYNMTITVGNRRIRGVAKERGEARVIYRRAVAAGKTAALLEQERPNIFTQSVANILPGEEIRVELRYVEDLLPEGKRYEFVFPMVVGPRYVGGGRKVSRQPKGGGWGEDSTRISDASRITPKVLRKGMRVGHDIALRLRIDGGGVAVRHLNVVTHKARITGGAASAATRVELAPSDSIPNKDFVVRYQLRGAAPQVGVLTHRDQRGGHMLLMVQPKEKMSSQEIAPREYVFVVDNSGSMHGFPMSQARAVMRRCLNNLRHNDTFQVIKFAGRPDRLAPRPLFATKANIRRGLRYVRRMQGGGGTEFLPALKVALRAPKDSTRSRIVLFITDGYIGYENEVLRYLRKYGGESNVFALGVGSSVNRFLIDGMARIGSGRPFYILNQEKAGAVVERIFSTISRPALTNIDLEWQGITVNDLSPATIPDLFGGRPVVLTGRFKKGGKGFVTVHGRLAGKPFHKKIPVTLPGAPTRHNEAVAYLWARRRIANQMDLYATEQGQQTKLKRSVTRTALAYNLISRFTSLVAVDDRVRNLTGKPKRVDQPVPLPEGVSEKAAPAKAYGLKGPAASKHAGNAGVMKMLRHSGEEGKMGGVFSKGSAFGSDAKDALGGLIGNQVGETYGVAGLGLVGTGQGGGGTGEGTIGLGTLGTIGMGGGSGSGVGYGRGVGRLGGKRSRAPMVKGGKAVVRGALSNEIIRRIIRRHVNEVRYCYQTELGGNPSLAGRLQVGFTISPTGQVAGVQVNSSSLNNQKVEACVSGAVGRWMFPKPKGGGIVVVNYPFNFGAAEAIKKAEAKKSATPKPAPVPVPKPVPKATPAPAPAPKPEPKPAAISTPNAPAKADPRHPNSDGGCAVSGEGAAAPAAGLLWLFLITSRLKRRKT